MEIHSQNIKPNTSQSNGLVEKTVRKAKNLMTKASENNEDPYLGLLELGLKLQLGTDNF